MIDFSKVDISKFEKQLPDAESYDATEYRIPFKYSEDFDLKINYSIYPREEDKREVILIFKKRFHYIENRFFWNFENYE